MLLLWLKRRRAASARVDADAAALLRQFGAAAYDEARERAVAARACRPVNPHWSRVRRAIVRRAGRRHVDTATRYLEP